MHSPQMQERFWPKVSKGNGCWIWLGVKQSKDGYGCFRIGATMMLAHRVSYEMVVGSIAEGLTLDHLCGNKSCVRPSHLEQVTAEENTRRYFASRPKPTHCGRGHSLEGSTVDKRGIVHCRQCNNLATARYREKRRRARRPEDYAPRFES